MSSTADANNLPRDARGVCWLQAVNAFIARCQDPAQRCNYEAELHRPLCGVPAEPHGCRCEGIQLDQQDAMDDDMLAVLESQQREDELGPESEAGLAECDAEPDEDDAESDENEP